MGIFGPAHKEISLAPSACQTKPGEQQDKACGGDGKKRLSKFWIWIQVEGVQEGHFLNGVSPSSFNRGKMCALVAF